MSFIADVLEKHPDKQGRHDDVRMMYDARTLYDALENWAEPTAAHERITAGNCIYRKAARVRRPRASLAATC